MSGNTSSLVFDGTVTAAQAQVTSRFSLVATAVFGGLPFVQLLLDMVEEPINDGMDTARLRVQYVVWLA